MKTALKILPWGLLAILTALRLWAAGAIAVTPLEAYYWMCAHHRDLAFFDGPPGTAGIIHVTTVLCGDNALGIRLAYPLLAFLATGAVFLVGRAIFGYVVGLWAAVALNALPFFNSAAIHAGPALPALVLLLLASRFFIRALDRGFLWWPLAGASLALATLFDYSSIFLLAGAAAVCVVLSRHRDEWRRAGIYVMALVALAGLIPGYLWNRDHDWPAFALDTLSTALTPRWDEIGPALGTATALFSVVALGGIGFAIWKLAGQSRRHVRPRIFLCLAAPFILLWLYGILRGEPGFSALLPACAILAVGCAHIYLETAPRRWIGALLLLLMAGSAASRSSNLPWSSSQGATPWKAVAASLDDLVARAQGSQTSPPPMVIAEDPDATAILNYYLSRVTPVDYASQTAPLEVFLRESQDVSNQFAFWPRYDDFVVTDKPTDDFFKQEGNTANPYMGRNALYLTDEAPSDLPETITGAFAHVTPFADLNLADGRKMRVYLCEDYQTMPL